MIMNNISIGFYTSDPDDGKHKWAWCGCWYKPWTWLRFKKKYIIKELQLFDSFIVNEDQDDQQVICVDDLYNFYDKHNQS